MVATESPNSKARIFPLSRALLSWFIALAIVPLLVAGFFAYMFMSKGLLNSSIENLLASSQQSIRLIDDWASNHQSTLDTLASWDAFHCALRPVEESLDTPSYPRSCTEDIAQTINAFLHTRSDVVGAIILDASGNIIFDNAHTHLDHANPKTKATIVGALSGQRFLFSDLFLAPKFDEDKELERGHSHEQPEFMGVIASPIFNDKKVLIGAIALELSMGPLLAQLPVEQMTYLLGQDNKLRSPVSSDMYKVMGRPVPEVRIDSNIWPVFDLVDKALQANQIELDSIYENSEIGRFAGIQDNLTIGVRRPISLFDHQWTYIAEADYDSVVKPARDAAIQATWLLILLMIAVAIIASWISRRITRPIESLTALTEAVMEGEISKRTHVSVKNEIGVLAKHLNRMLDVREKNENIIRSSYAESEEALLALNQQKYALDQHSIVEITDLNGVITFANSKCEEITGYMESELVGSTYTILDSGQHSSEFWAAMYQTIVDGGVWRGEICNRSKNGAFYWVDTTIAPFMRDGKPESFIAIRNDITLAKLTELELLEAKNAAEDGTKAKSDFLASMSHEIRTPMNGVLGMLNLLMQTSLDEGQRRQAQLAYGSAESLLTIINDILDFSKIEAGKLELEMMDFHLRDLFSEFAASIGPRIYEKDLELVLDLKGIDRDKVKGDPGRLRQVLINLVGNAIKFTEKGQITVRASLLESYSNRLKLDCSIEDTGIGIPSEKQSGLFDSFSQVDASTTRKYGGTGLGLTIVKQLCDLMGGHIHVESEYGEGSAFHFSVYFENAEDVRFLSDEGEAVIGQRVLVVDDNPALVENLCKQLECWGSIAVGIDNLDEWLEFKESVDLSDRPYDVMLVKLSRDGDKNTLTEAVMSCEQLKQVPKVAMTELASMVSPDVLKANGFQAGITKPCVPDELLRTLVYLLLGQSNNFSLEELVAEVSAYENSVKEQLISLGSKIRILLVEDNPVNQIVASSLLDQLGLSCDTAGNGREAVTALKRAPSDAPYDLVLMDCQMPELDGYEATREIREGFAGDRNKDVIIVAMTANAMKGDREKCLEAGMDDYISKPVSAENLEATLGNWLLRDPISEETNMTEPLNSDAEESEGQNIEGGTPMSESNSDEMVWDKQSALDNLAGSEEIYAALLEASMLDIPENIEKLEQAIKDTDIDMARISAHSLKGVAASIGAMVLMDVAKQAEMAAREENLAQVSTFLPTIVERFDEFKDALDA